MNKNCEYNVICGDIDDRDPNKWCASCKAKLKKEKRDAKVVDDLRSAGIIVSER